MLFENYLKQEAFVSIANLAARRHLPSLQLLPYTSPEVENAKKALKLKQEIQFTALEPKLAKGCQVWSQLRII